MGLETALERDQAIQLGARLVGRPVPHGPITPPWSGLTQRYLNAVNSQAGVTPPTSGLPTVPPMEVSRFDLERLGRIVEEIVNEPRPTPYVARDLVAEGRAAFAARTAELEELNRQTLATLRAREAAARPLRTSGLGGLIDQFREYWRPTRTASSVSVQPAPGVVPGLLRRTVGTGWRWLNAVLEPLELPLLILNLYEVHWEIQEFATSHPGYDYIGVAFRGLPADYETVIARQAIAQARQRYRDNPYNAGREVALTQDVSMPHDAGQLRALLEGELNRIDRSLVNDPSYRGEISYALSRLASDSPAAMETEHNPVLRYQVETVVADFWRHYNTQNAQYTRLQQQQQMQRARLDQFSSEVIHRVSARQAMFDQQRLHAAFAEAPTPPSPAGGEPVELGDSVPFLGALTNMSLMKGTIDFNSVQGGWSESVYSAVLTETPASMTQKMIGLLAKRMLISVGPENVACTNPVVPYDIRVEDELLQRDAQVTYCVPAGSAPVQNSVPIPPGFTGGANPVTDNQNLDLELGLRVKMQSGFALQYAYPMFHGVPFYAVQGSPGTIAGQDAATTAFLRNPAFKSTYIANVNNMIAYMAQVGIGYRNITGAWNGPNNTNGPYSAPARWVYDTTNEQIQLWWTTVGGTGQPPNFPPPAGGYDIRPQAAANWPMPNSLCRLQVRGWKGFKPLNGRWAARVLAQQTINNVVYPFGLQILRQCRLPQIGDTNVPMVSPIAWTPWFPSAVLAPNNYSPSNGPNPTIGWLTTQIAAWNQIQYVESKKLGRTFGLERGRQRNRAV